MPSQKCFDDEDISDSGISDCMVSASVCIGEKASSAVLENRFGEQRWRHDNHVAR